MRNLNDIPIRTFVTKTYASPKIQAFVENWRIDPEVVIIMLIEFFKDMGIERVTLVEQSIVTSSMEHFLRHSPELQKKLAQAHKDSLHRSQSRHAS